MKINTKRVSVGMPPNLYGTLKMLAEESGRTVPGYVRRLIWTHVDEKGIAVSLSPEEK